ncbi:MAG TPA: DUF4079 family protein [Myxococcota bacterium]|nr:DUF4079 family protein [Myxococcota bacterium]
MHALVYLHPLAMVALLTLALFVLRDGLRIRRGRLLRRPVDSRRHRRLARVVVVLALVGFGSGLVSMGWLRGKELFESVHAWLATGALVGFSAGGALGLALERRGRGPIRRLHALTASAGLLLGLAAAMAGFAILP